MTASELRTAARAIASIEAERPVMLAKSYDDFRPRWPVHSQPKLDGHRMTLGASGALTRTGNRIVTMPHVAEALSPLFAAHPDLVLDGEIYNHDLRANFNRISSLARKTKPTADDLRECRGTLQFHVYDCHLSGVFSDRFASLCEILPLDSLTVRLVATTLCQNQAELDAAYDGYLADGYEGQMVRLPGEYVDGRSPSLLKRKEFSDAEFEIVDATEGEGKWAGLCGRVILRAANGETFGATPVGTDAERAELLASRDAIVGMMGTVQFNGLTPSGIPRFAKFKAVRFDADRQREKELSR